MLRGWFVGDFEPTVFPTAAVEVGIKHYRAGDTEEGHHHNIATEITVIVSGAARMGAEQLSEGEILVLNPGEESDFEALTDVTLVAVKLPAARNDKYV